MSGGRRQEMAAATPILIFHQRVALSWFLQPRPSPGQALDPDTCKERRRLRIPSAAFARDQEPGTRSQEPGQPDPWPLIPGP